jgi:hypothetical protein
VQPTATGGAAEAAAGAVAKKKQKVETTGQKLYKEITQKRKEAAAIATKVSNVFDLLAFADDE